MSQRGWCHPAWRTQGHQSVTLQAARQACLASSSTTSKCESHRFQSEALALEARVRLGGMQSRRMVHMRPYSTGQVHRNWSMEL
jgi:hypothetical protein